MSRLKSQLPANKKEPPETLCSEAAFLVCLYAAIQIFSDIGSLKIASVAGFSVDVGTFIYPISFTLRDFLHKKTDKKTVRAVIFACAASNVFMAAYFWIAALIPPNESWGLNSQFAAVLTPVWRITAASILAEVASELLDTEIYEAAAKRFGEKRLWIRVVLSNAASIPVDSAVFCAAAFLGALPFSTVIEIFFANFALKLAISLAVLPAMLLRKPCKNAP